MEKRWEETELKSEDRERVLRFTDVTRELLHEMPVKKQGSVPCCQFWRMFGLWRDDLKLNNLSASLVFAVEEAPEAKEGRETEQSS